MISEYEKPSVEIISFIVLEQLATEQDARTTRDAGVQTVDDTVNLGSMPTIGEGVEDWG